MMKIPSESVLTSCLHRPSSFESTTWASVTRKSPRPSRPCSLCSSPSGSCRGRYLSPMARCRPGSIISVLFELLVSLWVLSTHLSAYNTDILVTFLLLSPSTLTKTTYENNYLIGVILLLGLWLDGRAKAQRLKQLRAHVLIHMREAEEESILGMEEVSKPLHETPPSSHIS